VVHEAEGNTTVWIGKDLTVFGKISESSSSSFLAPFSKMGKPWPGFGPGTFALPRQRSTRLSYQGANAP
jgi:hypothetical protein